MAKKDANKAKKQIAALVKKANRRRADNTKASDTAQMRAQGDVEGDTFVVRAGENPDEAFERWRAYHGKG